MELTENLRSTTLADHVEMTLLDYIRRRGLRPGEPLPKEEEFAARFRVSRHVLREGLSKLKTLGIIESRKRKGMILSKPDVFSGIGKLAGASLFTPEECREFMSLRVVMELGMTEFIFQKKTPSQLEELRRCAAASAGPTPGREAEMDFHSKLFAIGGNRTADKFRNILSSAFGAGFEAAGRNSSKLPTHHDICDALEHGTQHEFYQTMKLHFQPYLD